MNNTAVELKRKLLSLARSAGLLPLQVYELYALLGRQGEARLVDLTRVTGIAQSALRSLARDRDEYIQIKGDKYILTPSGSAFSSELVEFRAWKDKERERAGKECLDLLKEMEVKRPRSKRRLDQFRATPATSVARAQVIDSQLLADEQHILFLGDNDITSLALAHISKPASIAVLDIDNEVLEAIGAVQGSAPIVCEQYDACEPLPRRYVHSFDLAVTDPPYSANGLLLFLSRLAQALVKDCRGHVFLSYGFSMRARERGLEMQRIVGDVGFLIYKIWPNLNEYYAAGSIGSRSNFYQLISTPRTKSRVPRRFGNPIYSIT